jgi:hypothetical protein
LGARQASTPVRARQIQKQEREKYSPLMEAFSSSKYHSNLFVPEITIQEAQFSHPSEANLPATSPSVIISSLLQ